MENKNHKFEYYFVISLTKREKDLHKIFLRTNEKNIFEIFGIEKDDVLLHSIHEKTLNDEFNAFVFLCKISSEVKRFRIFLESNHKILYKSKIINIYDDLVKKNNEFIFFNLNLFENQNTNTDNRNPLKSSILTPSISFQILKICFKDLRKDLRELYEFSFIHVHDNIKILIDVLNSIKEHEMIELLIKLINLINFKFILSEINKSQNLLNEFNLILEDGKIEAMLKDNKNDHFKPIRPELIKYIKLQMILLNDEKKIRMIINFLDFKDILDCVDIIISSGKLNFKYVMFLLNYLVQITKFEEENYRIKIVENYVILYNKSSLNQKIKFFKKIYENKSEPLSFENKKTYLFEKGIANHFSSQNIEDFKFLLFKFLDFFNEENSKNFLEMKCNIDLNTLLDIILNKIKESLSHEENLKFLFELIEFLKNSKYYLFDIKLIETTIKTIVSYSINKINFEIIWKKIQNYDYFLDKFIQLSNMVPDYFKENLKTNKNLVELIDGAMNCTNINEIFCLKFSQVKCFESIIFNRMRSLIETKDMHLKTLKHFLKFLTIDFLRELDPMKSLELMTKLFQHFYSIELNYNEFDKLKEIYDILLEKVKWIQKSVNVMSYVFDNLITLDFFKKYKIEKLIKLNDNVGESFYSILVNQLDVSKFNKINTIIQFYSHENLDFKNDNLIEIFSFLLDKLPPKLENENAILFKNNAEFYKSLYSIKTLFESLIVKKTKYFELMKNEFIKIYNSVMEKSIKIEELMKIKIIKSEPDEFKIKLEVMKLFLENFEMDIFEKELDKMISLSFYLKTTFIKIKHFAESFLYDVNNYKEEFIFIGEINKKIDSFSINQITEFNENLLINNFENIDDFYKLSFSKILMNKFNEEKKKNDQDLDSRKVLLLNCREYLNQFNSIFINKNKIQIKNIQCMFNKIKIKDLENEMTILIDYFKIKLDNKEIDELKKTITIILNFNEFKQKIHHTYDLVVYFKINNVKFIRGLYDKISDNVDVNFSITAIDELNRELDTFKYDEIYSLIEEMNECKTKLLDFIKDKTQNDFMQLNEFTDDIGDSFIKPSTIKDLILALTFYQQLTNGIENISDLEFFERILKYSKESIQKKKPLDHIFKSVNENFTGIFQLFMKAVNKEEFSKFKIKELYSFSIFNIKINKEGYYCKVQYGLKDSNGNYIKKFKKEKFDNIIDLKDRSLVQANKKIDSDENEQDNIPSKQCSEFCVIVENIVTLLESLNELFNKGYPKTSLPKIKWEKGTILITDEENIYDNFEGYLDILNKILTNWNDKIEELYKKEYLSTFFHGRQLNILWNYFNGKEKYENEIFELIKYLLDCDTESINLDEINYKYDNSLNLIENFSSCLYQCLNKLYFQNIKKSEFLNDQSNKNGKVFPLKIYSENFDNILISTLLTKYQNLPCLNKTLFCRSTTTKEEILSFSYRFYYSPLKVYFIILKIDELNHENKTFFLEILTNLFKQERNIFADLIITYESSFDFIRQLSKVKFIPIENLQFNQSTSEEFKKLSKEIFNSVLLISSECCGIGKTTLIKDMAKEKNLELVYLPLSGDIDWKDIIKRLDKLKNSQISKMIHIDLGDCSNYFIMNELFSCILIFKGISILNHLYFFNKYEIAIEIPNSFTNFKSVFPLLNSLNEIEITKKDKRKFKITNDPHLQLVLNYLSAYKDESIINKNIYFSCECKNKKNHSDMCPYYESKNVTEISENTGLELLESICDINFYSSNFYQINSLISILANQCIKYSKSIFFAIKNLRRNLFSKLVFENKVNLVLRCRLDLIKSFIDLTKYFTKGAYDNLIQNQNNSIIEFPYKNDEMNSALEILSMNKFISFNDIHHSLVLFNDDNMSISIINSLDIKDILYEKLTNLLNSSSYKKIEKLKNYRKDKINFLEEVKTILNINKKIDPVVDLNRYVFTSDNFIKLILILLRLQSGIPIIMIGETGCGKTSLIKTIAKLKSNQESFAFDKIIKIVEGMTEEEFINDINKINDDAKNSKLKFHVNIEGSSSKVSTNLIKNLIFENKLKNSPLSNNITFNFQKEKIILKTINIHAGITDEFLITEIEKISNEAILNNLCSFWVFLDEINTCMSMGLISELICYRTILGNSIPKNILFIGACNPYRKITYLRTNNSKVGLENTISRKLAYRVNPLPYRLLNFVFDFGYLTTDDEMKYISSMIQGRDFEGLSLNNLTECILESQFFIKNISEASCVSLRDVRRFVDIFDWYKKSLEERKSKQSQYGKISIIISFYISYYLRLEEKTIRIKYIELIAKFLKISKEEIIKIIEIEKNDIIERIKVPIGIAKNDPLLENIFALFICIFLKIPIIICGKPGCSKSLSVQLLYSSIKGKDSEDKYLKKLPRIFINSYQGSRTSTSKGVQKVFDKATQFQKGSNKDEEFSVVYFDELGLAEISPNNPLKILHFTLEPEKEEDKVAFIGISNWTLDASKMNRLIFVARPDLDLDDLFETAKVIAKSFKNGIEEKYDNVFKALSKSYFEYKALIKESKNLDDYLVDFHGTRDFYSINKYIANILSLRENDIKENELEKMIEKAIERNFGGMPDSIKMMKEIFNKNFIGNYGTINPSKYDVFDCVNSNLTEENSRFLMIISEYTISESLIISILVQLEKKYIYLMGSEFDGDNQEQYTYKILNKIQVCMEQGKLLIINKLNEIYPSLYDLFNQNYSSVGGKNYCRIAVGTANNPLALVHKNFKCIVIMDQNDILKQDAPFLNRFEKHSFSYEKLLSVNELEIANEILDNLKTLTISKKNKFVYHVNNLMININKSEIFALVYKFKLLNYPSECITNEIFKLLSGVFPQDIIIGLEESKSSKKMKNKIKEYYNYIDHSSLMNYLSKIKSNSKKFMIYSFTSLFEKISLNFIDFQSILISSINSEKELENFYREFFKKDTKLLIVRFCPQDCQLLSIAKFLFEQLVSENKNEKQIIFICHVERHLIDYKTENECIPNQTISYCSDWNFAFIDDLNGKIDKSIIDILDKNYFEIFKEKLFSEEEIIRKIIYPIYIKIVPNLVVLNNNVDINYFERMCSLILSNKELIEIFLDKICNNNLLKTNWRDDILYNNSNILSTGDIFSLLKLSYKKKLENSLYITLLHLENHNLLECLLYLNESIENETNKQLFEFCILSIKNWQPQNTVDGRHKIILPEKIQYLKIPNFGSILKKIKEEIPIEENKSKENELRNKIIDVTESTQDFINNFKIHKIDLVRSLSKGLEKIEIFKKLYELINNKREIIEFMIQDYLHFYLSSIMKNYSKITFEFLQFLLKFKNRDLPENISINVFSESILWLETNNTFINYLIKGIEEIAIYDKNFIEKFSVFCEKNTIKFPNDENKKLKKEVNEIFYVFVNQIMSFLLEDIIIVIENEGEQEFYNKITIFLNVVQYFKILNDGLILFSTLLIKFTFLSELISISSRKATYYEIKENLLKILKFENENSSLFQNINNEQNLIKYINQYSILIDDLINKLNRNQIDSIAELYNFFYINKFKENKNKNYRINILKIVLENNFLKQNCKDFVLFIFCNYKDYKVIPPTKKMVKEDEEDEEEEEEEDNFAEFLEKDNDEFLPIFEENIRKNEYLREVVFLIFESKLMEFFKKLDDLKIIQYDPTKDNEFLFDNFKIAIKEIEDCLYKQNWERNLKDLTSLYMISYIKSFIDYFMKIILDNFSQINNPINVDLTNLVKFLLEKKNNFKKSIFIYIFKIVRATVKNFEQFKEINFTNLGLNIIYREFEIKDELFSSSLSHKFIDLNDFDKFEEFENSFEFIDNNEKKIEIMKSNPLFFTFACINKIFSKCLKEKFTNSKEIKKFIFWCNINYEEKFKNIPNFNFLHLMILKTEKFIEILKNKDEKFLHMFMHSFVLASISFNSIGTNNYFIKLNLDNIFDFLEDNYILGSELKDCGQLEKNYKSLVDHHYENVSCVGAYICKCKLFYTLGPCGSPIHGSNMRCPQCNFLIGGHPDGPHKLERGKGVYRIFKDKEQQENVFKYYGNEDYDWKILEDINNELNNEKLKSEQKSIYFSEMSLVWMRKKKRTVRNLDPLTYRILSFYYNSLVFLLKTEKNEEKLKNIYLSSSPLELMEINYQIIEELLREKGVNNSSLFLLFLESKIGNLFNSLKSTTQEERRFAENYLNSIVQSCLIEFDEKKEDLDKFTSNKNRCESNSIFQSILEEKFDKISKKEEIYPHLRDFRFKSLPNKEELIKIITNDNEFSQKYPVLHLIIINKDKLDQLKCLISMNKLVNLLMDNFCFKIDREYAEKITIEKAFDEIKIDSKILEKYFNEFNKSWKYIRQNAKKYLGKKEMEVKESFSKSDTLSYLLNDDNDDKNGMYLAAAYQYLISLQNDILSKIKSSLIQSTSGKNFIKLLDEEISIQDAKEINILNENYGLDFNNLNELLFYYSFRNENLKSIKYKFSAMEIYLREAILIGKKTFKEKQKFFIYKYETYKGDNSSILTNFIKKYPQVSLPEYQKEIINQFCLNCKNITDILSNLNIILFFCF